MYLLVKYTCSDAGVLKFTASGTATLVNVHAKDKKDTCGTGVTTADDKVGFTGPNAGKVVGEFTDAKSAACGYIKDPAVSYLFIRQTMFIDCCHLRFNRFGSVW